jgi:hypothetical protein
MMDDLRMEGFESFGRPTAPIGVYVLIGKGQVLYVGKSLNLYMRIGAHVTAMRRFKKGMRPYKGREDLPFFEFDQVLVKLTHISQIDAEERKLIQRFLPESNTHYCRPDVSSIPAVARMIKDAPRAVSLHHGNSLGVVRRRAA